MEWAREEQRGRESGRDTESCLGGSGLLKSKKEKGSGYITQGDPLCCRNNNTSILILFSRREGGVRVGERGIDRERDFRNSREREKEGERGRETKS